uniref:Flavin-containing monooxygenase n=1 Tax=Panagrellus redivivus TaxID=6233 RepID=A0A7E4V9K5_PANRE
MKKSKKNFHESTSRSNWTRLRSKLFREVYFWLESLWFHWTGRKGIKGNLMKDSKTDRTTNPKHVLVVGAGASGLPAIKSCLEYGFSVVCFERSNDIGGLWRYKNDPVEDEGTVMYSTVINTSKEMTAYSDFPPPSENANYMHNRDLLKYFRTYAAHFKLEDYIKYEHEVITIERALDFDESGQWEVTYRDVKNDEIHHENFDGVMLCTGHHSIPHWPEPFPGQSEFLGEIIHSHSFHTGAPFAGKNVVVVGIGNSGGDIAVELSKLAGQVHLSTRSGSWVINRVWDHGEPSDLAYLNRFTWFLKGIAPRSWQNAILERKVNRRFDHGRFGLKPDFRFLEAHVTVNDELPNRIISGTVVVKPNIARFEKKNVIFDDGTVAKDVDVVIFATGFKFSFNLVEDGQLISAENNKVTLYKFMYPPQLAPQNNFAIIGLIQPTGSIMPISEMQTRVFCSVLAGESKLPNPAEMLESAQRSNEKNRLQYVDRPRHTLQVYYVTYMESLARLIGVQPKIKKYWFTDWTLAKKLVFHGLVPYQYRLDGTHSWSGARDAILGVEERVFNCTMTRKTKATEKSKPVSKFYVWKFVF